MNNAQIYELDNIEYVWFNDEKVVDMKIKSMDGLTDVPLYGFNINIQEWAVINMNWILHCQIYRFKIDQDYVYNKLRKQYNMKMRKQIRQKKEKGKILYNDSYDHVKSMGYNENNVGFRLESNSSKQYSMCSNLGNKKSINIEHIDQQISQSIEGNNIAEVSCYGFNNNIVIINNNSCNINSFRQKRLNSQVSHRKQNSVFNYFRKKSHQFSYNSHTQPNRCLNKRSKLKCNIIFILSSYFIIILSSIECRKQKSVYEKIVNNQEYQEKQNQKEERGQKEGREEVDNEMQQYQDKQQSFKEEMDNEKECVNQSDKKNMDTDDKKQHTVRQTEMIYEQIMDLKLSKRNKIRKSKKNGTRMLNMRHTICYSSQIQESMKSYSQIEIIRKQESIQDLIQSQIKMFDIVLNRLYKFVVNLNLVKNTKLQLYQKLLMCNLDISDISCIQINDQNVITIEYNEQKQIYDSEQMSRRIARNLRTELQEYDFSQENQIVVVNEHYDHFRIIASIYGLKDNMQLLMIKRNQKYFILINDRCESNIRLESQQKYECNEFQSYLNKFVRYLFQEDFAIDILEMMIFNQAGINEQGEGELQDRLLQFQGKVLKFCKKQSLQMMSSFISDELKCKCQLKLSNEYNCKYDDELKLKIRDFEGYQETQQQVIQLDDEYQIILTKNDKDESSYQLIQQAIYQYSLHLDNMVNSISNQAYEYEVLKEQQTFILVYNLEFQLIHSNKVIDQKISKIYSLDNNMDLINYPNLTKIIENIKVQKQVQRVVVLNEQNMNIKVCYRQNRDPKLSQIQLYFQKQSDTQTKRQIGQDEMSILSIESSMVDNQLISRNYNVPQMMYGMENINFDILSLDTEQSQVDFVYTIFMRCGFLNYFNVEMKRFTRFINTLKYYYNRNGLAFHNFQHGIAVFHGCYLFARELDKQLDRFEQLCLIFSGLCHDVDHTGFNNSFEINSRSKLGLRYNDMSVLEKHHISTTFRILSQDCNDIFQNSKLDYQRFKKTITNNIMSTDMSQHFQIIEEFGAISNQTQIYDDKQKLLISGYFLHSADFAGAIKPFNQAQQWSIRVNREFTNQYQQEGILGIQQTPFMKDLHVESVLAKGESGFIQFIVLPLYQKVNQMLNNKFKYLEDQLQQNINQWQKKINMQIR